MKTLASLSHCVHCLFTFIKTCAIDINKDDTGISLALIDAAAEALRNSVIDDLNLCTHWGELLHALSSKLRTRFEHMSVSKGGLSKDTNLSQEASGSQLCNHDQKVPESTAYSLHEISEQSMKAAASNTDAADILITNQTYQPGGYASNWDDLSSWLDGHVSAASVSQMPWQGDQGLFGMLEPFMGCLGDYRIPDL